MSTSFWNIIIFFLSLCVVIIVISWWWYYFENPTSLPENLTVKYQETTPSNTFIYEISWTNGDQWPCLYVYSLKDATNDAVISSGKTFNLNYATQGLQNGTYSFQIAAQAKTLFSVKHPSKKVTIIFEVNNPR
jgi:hypothetical protein